MATEGHKLAARGEFPQVQRLLGAGRKHGFAVRGENRGVEIARDHYGAQLLARAHVPEFQRALHTVPDLKLRQTLVVAAGGQGETAIGGKPY